jgi:hypothetical protein
MRAQIAAFVLHIAVGFAALVLAFYSAPVPLILCLIIWLLAVGVSGLGT